MPSQSLLNEVFFPTATVKKYDDRLVMSQSLLNEVFFPTEVVEDIDISKVGRNPF